MVHELEGVHAQFDYAQNGIHGLFGVGGAVTPKKDLALFYVHRAPRRRRMVPMKG